MSNRKKLLLSFLSLTIVCFIWSESSIAQFGGRGAFGTFEDFIRNLTVSIGLKSDEVIDNDVNGVVCFNGNGETFNEDICIDLEFATNTITTYSNTGVTLWSVSNSWTLSTNTGNSFYFPAAFTSDPCSAGTSSGIFWNQVNGEMCYCNAAGVDLRLDDGSTACF